MSNITISTHLSYPYTDRWDGGQLGFIYVSKEKCLKEWNRKHWSKQFQKLIEKSLDSEVKTYDDYLNNNVYGYQIFDFISEDGKYDGMDCIDSCWGYYPDHDDKHDYDACLREAKQYIRSLK